MRKIKICFLFSSGDFESANNKKWFKLFAEKYETSISVLIQETDKKMSERFKTEYKDFFSVNYFPTPDTFSKFFLLERLRYIRDTARWIDEIQPDIIHIHGVYFTYMIMPLLFLKRRPIIIYNVWGSDINIAFHKKIKTKLIIKWLIKNSDLIWTNWFAMKDKVAKMFPMHKSKIVSIPLGVERNLFNNVSQQETDNIQKKFSIKEQTYIMLYVRGFIPNSNQDKLIKALSHLDKELNYTLILHNPKENPEYERILSRLIEMYKLEDKVKISHLNLTDPEVKALFKTANLSFSITSNEQFSRTISESILSDTHLILSNIEPYIYLKNHYKFNVDLVDVSDSRYFSRILKNYIQNPTIPDYTKEKKIIKDLFDFESKYDKFMNIYKNLIANASKD